MIAANLSDPASIRWLTSIPYLQFKGHPIRLESFLSKLNSNCRRGVSIVIINVSLEEVRFAYIALPNNYD